MGTKTMLFGVFLAAILLIMVPSINAFNNISIEDKETVKPNQDILKNVEDTGFCETFATLSMFASWLGLYLLSNLFGMAYIACILFTGSSSSNSCSICVT